MTTFRCDIVSAEDEIFHGEAELLVATGEIGELGIAPRHAPLITRLKPGKVVVTLPGGEQLDFAVSGGILEVQPQVVTVLADTAIRAQDIDEAAVRKAKEEAERMLAAQGSEDERRGSRSAAGHEPGAAAGAGAPAQEHEALSRARFAINEKRRPSSRRFCLRRSLWRSLLARNGRMSQRR